MKIYIDVSVLTLATYVTGIQRVTREIIVRLIRKEGDSVVLLHYNAKENRFHRIDNAAFIGYYVYGQGIKNRMITKSCIALSEIGKGSLFFELDGVWMSRVKRSWLLPILKKQGARIVVHVYDIISITHPQYSFERGVFNFMDYLAAHMQYADQIIVNAKATVEELKNLAERIGIPLPPCKVVPLGSDFGERKPIQERLVADHLVEVVKSAPYILMVGTIEPRKNHSLLLRAYEEGLKEAGYHLIFAGYMGWNMEEFERRLHNHPDFGKRIFHFQGLDDMGIGYLYQNARYLAFCSYQEGFGLPIVESIIRGTPVLCPDQPVYREVGEDYPIWFKQENPESLCEKVAYYDENPEEYKKMKEHLKNYKPITWDDSFGYMEEALLQDREKYEKES